MTPRHHHGTRARQAGLSLVELLVALTIGLFLMAGAISVFGKTRDLYRTNEATARLQDAARYAMSTLEGDLRMASYWGPSNRADFITNTAAPGQTLDAALSPYEAVIDACGDNWAVDTATYVEGSNNAYGLGCGAFGSAVGGADALTIRRASREAISDAGLAASNGRLKLRASRSQGTIFGGTALPAGLTGAGSETRALVAHGYYVDDDSDERSGTPSLRRKQLWFDAAAAVPVIQDQQVVSGIADLQVEVGVDTNGDQGADYFTTFDGVAAGDAIVALRVWVLARAEQADATYTDDRTYEYADRAAFTPGDNFRRLLVSKTIQLRNTRQ